MYTLFSRLRRLILVTGLLLGGSAVALAQVPTVQVVEETPERLVLDVVAAWAWPLPAAVDSARLTRLTDAGLFTLAQGTLAVSETVALGRPALPVATVLSAEYDAVPLPVDTVGVLMRAVMQEPVELLGLGLERKRPVVTVQVRLFRYDAATGQLWRYRRLRVQIDRSAARLVAKSRFEAGDNPHLAVTQSILADGTIFRIQVTQEGVYRIDRQLLTELGLTPASIDPDHLRLYGNGGAPVPGPNSTFRYADLVENPVWVRGGGDGAFNEGDAVYFYAAAPSGWRWVFNTGRNAWEWQHYTHPFSNENFYFLKVATAVGVRVETPPFPNYPDAVAVTSVTGRHLAEFDDYMWSKEHGSGHTWVSNPIRPGGSLNVLQNVDLPGLVEGSVTYRARAGIKSNPRATVVFEQGGQRLGELLASSAVLNAEDAPIAVAGEVTFSQALTSTAPVSLTMRVLEQLNEPEAALDWLRVFYPQALTARNDLLRFATPGGQGGRLEFTLQGFSQEPQVWDVTTPDAIRRLAVQPGGNGYRLQVEVVDANQPRELIAFVEGVATRVAQSATTRVTAQNLHGLPNYPDLVIITPAAFLEQANRLAEHRRSQGLDVAVTPIEQVYNEFSGGLPDMRAIRDYFRFLYDRAATDDQLLRYALLFGDGHYNFRSRGAIAATLQNWIFPYETELSFDPVASYTSDDYFAFLDENEGVWAWDGISSTTRAERMDIGIGRLPVQTAAEAQLMVDKLLRYDDPATFGAWRTNYLFLADDAFNGLRGDDFEADLHLRDIDFVAETVRTRVAPQVNPKKIYADSFDRVFLNGFHIPGAKDDLLNTLESGVLLFNYSGHGGPDGLAQEELLTKEDAEALTNKDRLPVVITATCSFGWWDQDLGQSGAEAMLLNPDGGSIAMLTTVRLAYTSGSVATLNPALNRALNEQLLKHDGEGLVRRLGDSYRDTKNTPEGLQGNSRRFSLLGDPSMRLGLPAQQVVIEQLNGQPLDQGVPRMQALDRVTLTGSVRRADGLVDEAFAGPIDVSVFDGERRVTINYHDFNPTPYYVIREDLIWRGEVQASAGRFSATFVVPKDIAYSNLNGRIAAYAASATRQALGYSERFTVGGTSDTPPQDAEGPRLELFLNDTTFVSGGLTPPVPELIVRLFDESGINTVGAGVGHEMLLVLNGDENNAVDLSSAFRSAANSYQAGEVRWKLAEQPTGPGSLTVRAWDVLNNSATAELTYLVAEAQTLSLRNVYNYPNPMSRQTRFVFEHNQLPGTPAQVQLRIYTLNGRPVRTLESEEALPSGTLTAGPVQIAWDGRDEDGDRLATGVYLYKLRVEVESAEGGKQVVEQIEKMAIIR